MAKTNGQCIEGPGGLPLVNIYGLNTNQPAEFGAAVTFDTTVAITGNATVGGTLAVTGAITGPRTPNVIVGAAAGVTVNLTAAQSGSIVIMPASSGTPVFTLPAVAAGLEFTFITANNTEANTIKCADAAVIHAKTAATGTAITSTATTGSLINTQSTAVVGDAIQLVCDGTAWWIKAQTGIYSVS